MKIKAPVVFVFFNRPETTRLVFNVIKQVRPENLYLVSDGPRNDTLGEDVIVNALRREVEGMIDWDVNLTLDYSNINLGCGVRVSTGIENALNKFGKAIIVEDDCLPSLSFFRYCETMLNLYENDERIGSISGTNFLPSNKIANDIGFANYPCIWGWATWKRAWEGYDREMSNWDDAFLDEIEKEASIEGFDKPSWKELFKWIKKNPKSTWDVQFWFLSLRNRKLTIFPSNNQINNIGATPEATHTTRWWFCNRKTNEYTKDSFSIPGKVIVDKKYNKYLQDEFYSDKVTYRNIYYRIVVRIKKMINK